jgi:hypothetical protein
MFDFLKKRTFLSIVQEKLDDCSLDLLNAHADMERAIARVTMLEQRERRLRGYFRAPSQLISAQGLNSAQSLKEGPWPKS